MNGYAVHGKKWDNSPKSIKKSTEKLYIFLGMYYIIYIKITQSFVRSMYKMVKNDSFIYRGRSMKRYERSTL